MVEIRFLVKRASHGILVILAAITVIFLLRHIAPGSPINAIAPPTASPETKALIAQQLGLDQPLHVQYIDYMSGVLTGDLGHSYVSQASVKGRIFSRLPATIELGIAATVVSIVLSIPLGVISAMRRNQPADVAATTFSLLGISTPNFWLGIMLALLLAVQWNVLPTSGRPIGFLPAFESLVFQLNPDDMVTWSKHMIMPAVTLGTYFTALITRLTRSEMLEELGQDYVKVCRAKGLPETLVVFKHTLRNSMIPVVTVIGLQIGYLINGSVVTEAVFFYPGMGLLLIHSILGRDWMLIQGILIFVSAGWVTMNFLVDIAYAVLDPRVGVEG